MIQLHRTYIRGSLTPGEGPSGDGMVNGRLIASDKPRFTAHDLGLRVIIVIKGPDTISSSIHLEEIHSACHTVEGIEVSRSASCTRRSRRKQNERVGARERVQSPIKWVKRSRMSVGAAGTLYVQV